MVSGSKDRKRGADLKSLPNIDHAFASLIVISIFNFVITLPRFDSGIPNGVDTQTHLFKALYLSTNYERYSRIPAWCSSWYGGVPFLQLYSPLSYYVLFAMGLTGLDIILAYKVLDCFFYVITPLSVYFLVRSLNLSKEVGVLAAAFFSITPLTIENFIFYDRFTTTMALPFICLFLGFFHRFLEDGEAGEGVLSILCCAALLLIHHLTAYAVGLFAVLLLLVHYLKNKELKHLMKATALTLLGVTLLSAFWLLPFITTVGHIAENPFYNRSNLFDYTNLWSLRSLMDGFNVFQFTFSILMIGLLMRAILFGKYGTALTIIVSSSVVLIACGFVFNTLGIAIASNFTPIGLCLFLLSYLTMLLIEPSWKKSLGLYLCGLWLIVFTWLSLGSNAYLFRLLPFWNKLDLLRFHNYTVIPTAIMASSLVVEALKESRNVKKRVEKVFRKDLRVVTPFMVVFLIVGSVLLGLQSATETTSFTHLRPNLVIPKGVINYFNSDSDNGRILPIECPDWIYVLPVYVGKPLIDGWYPQEKLLKPLLEIDDYRINDLVCTLFEKGEDAQKRRWLNLIGNYSELGISWVMIGKKDKTHIMEGTDFEVSAKVEGISIYKARREVSFVDVFPRNAVGDIGFSRLSPEEMRITLEDVRGEIDVKVKEAYYPGWNAYVDGSEIEIGADDYGFISFHLGEGEAHSVVLSYEESVSSLHWIISIATLLTLFAELTVSLAKNRKLHR